MDVDPIVDTSPIEGECVGPNEEKCFMMRKVLHAQATIDKDPQKESTQKIYDWFTTSKVCSLS